MPSLTRGRGCCPCPVPLASVLLALRYVPAWRAGAAGTLLAHPVRVWFASTVADGGGQRPSTTRERRARVAVDGSKHAPALLLAAAQHQVCDVRHRKGTGDTRKIGSGGGCRVFRFTPDRVPTGPRAFFLAFTATASVDRAGREPGARVRGEAPTAALGFGPHLLWRIEPATPGEDMPRCSSGWWPHLWRALTLPARPRVAGAWRDRGPYHMRMCCRRSVSPLWTTAFYSSHRCAGDWRRIHVMDSSSHQLMNNISHLKPRRARAGTVLWSSLLRRRRMRGRRRTGLRGRWRRRAARQNAERFHVDGGA